MACVLCGQMKRLVRWGAATFFACTIGFEVPALTGSGSMFQPAALGRAALLFVAAVVGMCRTGCVSAIVVNCSIC